MAINNISEEEQLRIKQLRAKPVLSISEYRELRGLVERPSYTQSAQTRFRENIGATPKRAKVVLSKITIDDETGKQVAAQVFRGGTKQRPTEVDLYRGTKKVETIRGGSDFVKQEAKAFQERTAPTISSTTRVVNIPKPTPKTVSKDTVNKSMQILGFSSGFDDKPTQKEVVPEAKLVKFTKKPKKKTIEEQIILKGMERQRKTREFIEGVKDSIKNTKYLTPKEKNMWVTKVSKYLGRGAVDIAAFPADIADLTTSVILSGVGAINMRNLSKEEKAIVDQNIKENREDAKRAAREAVDDIGINAKKAITTGDPEAVANTIITAVFIKAAKNSLRSKKSATKVQEKVNEYSKTKETVNKLDKGEKLSKADKKIIEKQLKKSGQETLADSFKKIEKIESKEIRQKIKNRIKGALTDKNALKSEFKRLANNEKVLRAVDNLNIAKNTAKRVIKNIEKAFDEGITPKEVVDAIRKKTFNRRLEIQKRKIDPKRAKILEKINRDLHGGDVLNKNVEALERFNQMRLSEVSESAAKASEKTLIKTLSKDAITKNKKVVNKAKNEIKLIEDRLFPKKINGVKVKIDTREAKNFARFKEEFFKKLDNAKDTSESLMLIEKAKTILKNEFVKKKTSPIKLDLTKSKDITKKVEKPDLKNYKEVEQPDGSIVLQKVEQPKTTLEPPKQKTSKAPEPQPKPDLKTESKKPFEKILEKGKSEIKLKPKSKGGIILGKKDATSSSSKVGNNQLQILSIKKEAKSDIVSIRDIKSTPTQKQGKTPSLILRYIQGQKLTPKQITELVKEYKEEPKPIKINLGADPNKTIKLLGFISPKLKAELIKKIKRQKNSNKLILQFTPTLAGLGEKATRTTGSFSGFETRGSIIKLKPIPVRKHKRKTLVNKAFVRRHRRRKPRK